MRRLFVVGASELQLPAILKAKEMGLYVGVADYNSQAIGVSYADEFFNVSTIDETGIYNAAKAFGADGIMTLATDMPMRSVAYTADKLKLSGISYDTAIKATDKGEMIKAFKSSNVEHPWYYIIKDSNDLKQIKSKLTFPCISKPVDNAGSRGVMLIKNYEDLIRAVKYSSENGRSGRVILEEYLDGAEVSVEVIVTESLVNVLQITDKLTTGAPHFVETGHTQPSRLDADSIDKIVDLATRAVKAIGINNGPAHVEIMMTKNGPKMIELGARMGGDCITTHLVPLSTGIDMVKATIQIALGESPDVTQKYTKGSAIRFFNGYHGVIDKVEGLGQAEKSEGVITVDFAKKAGDFIKDIDSSIDRIGYVITQAENANEAERLCESALKKIHIITR